MFKFSQIFGLLMLAKCISTFVAPGEISIKNFSPESAKIASGVAAKRGENLDFCYLSILFIRKRQTCGCFILSEEFVMTSARCVYE